MRRNGLALPVVQEAGRLFCSRCGNAALEKVEVTIGADGQVPLLLSAIFLPGWTLDDI